MSEETPVTCDNCGTTEIARGLVGWLHVDKHAEAIDVTQMGQVPFKGADLCGWKCLGTYGEERAT